MHIVCAGCTPPHVYGFPHWYDVVFLSRQSTAWGMEVCNVKTKAVLELFVLGSSRGVYAAREVCQTGCLRSSSWPPTPGAWRPQKCSPDNTGPPQSLRPNQRSVRAALPYIVNVWWCCACETHRMQLCMWSSCYSAHFLFCCFLLFIYFAIMLNFMGDAPWKL